MPYAGLEYHSGLNVHTFEDCQYEVRSRMGGMEEGSIDRYDDVEGRTMETAATYRSYRIGVFRRCWVKGYVARGLGRKGFAVRGFRSLYNVPFEFEGEISCACTMAEAGHVERGTTSRHSCL
jgi:hypothetical protein